MREKFWKIFQSINQKVTNFSINYASAVLISDFFSSLDSTFFNANPRPDALMKEQLVEMTGLSPRVIRVWFQNKRCKHNKKTNALKIQMEQEKVRWNEAAPSRTSFDIQNPQEMKQIGYGRMHGVPLVATSPVRNDESPINLHGFEVTQFQPPWKMISELAMHADSKNNGMHQMHSPAYQDIVNQVNKEPIKVLFHSRLINLYELHTFA